MERLATADGATTALRGGKGPDLFIVHSLLTDRDAFQAVLPDLVERFRVTLLNLPGFHGSRPIPGTLTAYEMWLAQRLRRVRHRIGLHRVRQWFRRHRRTGICPQPSATNWQASSGRCRGGISRTRQGRVSSYGRKGRSGRHGLDRPDRRRACLSFRISDISTTTVAQGGQQPGLNFVRSSVADYRLFLGDSGRVGVDTGESQGLLHVAGTAANAPSRRFTSRRPPALTRR